ncbi:hypothetical protein NDU88_010755 [Pleurodeles waltl]|uniref:Uncharacterized protein n=1 Tax=Pleurodeles waltl TaxID=8319 RepID=A0AAV7PW55_PLEWA|nr:hypothetical protein NDU88_010755 [Pleurodeles waltl]
MVTLQNASGTAFRGRDDKTRTDSPAEGEDAADQRAGDGERDPDEEDGDRPFEGGERTGDSATVGKSSRGARHDPGGSWLAKLTKRQNAHPRFRKPEQKRVTCRLKIPKDRGYKVS